MDLPICEYCGGAITEFCAPTSHYPYYPCWSSPEARERPGPEPRPTGCCPKCGRAMDDHDGLVKDKPKCPKGK